MCKRVYPAIANVITVCVHCVSDIYCGISRMAVSTIGRRNNWRNSPLVIAFRYELMQNAALHWYNTEHQT